MLEGIPKLLAVHISEDLKWDAHVDSILTKASQRLMCLAVGKQAGII